MAKKNTSAFKHKARQCGRRGGHGGGDGRRHPSQAAMLHFAFRQNTATIKNSWQSGWIITGALMHSRKSQRLVKKEEVDTLSRLCFTFRGCITYRLWASDMPRAVLFIYSSLPVCVTAPSPPLLPLNPVDQRKSGTRSWMIHILYFHYHYFSHTVTYTLA